jgi:ribonuclease HI
MVEDVCLFKEENGRWARLGLSFYVCLLVTVVLQKSGRLPRPSREIEFKAALSMLLSDLVVAFRSTVRVSSQRLVRWSCPDEGWVKFNVDGSPRGNPGEAGARGILRNDTGGWCMGFSCYLGPQSNMFAELWAIRQGLLIAWDKGFRSLIVETDSLEAIHNIQSKPPHSPFLALLSDIKELMQREWRCKLGHVLREANACADFLAKLGPSLPNDLTIWATPPPGLRMFLLSDASGTFHLRL